MVSSDWLAGPSAEAWSISAICFRLCSIHQEFLPQPRAKDACRGQEQTKGLSIIHLLSWTSQATSSRRARGVWDSTAVS